MKGWLVTRGRPILGCIGDVYATHADAMTNCPYGYDIVEIELPDPPQSTRVVEIAVYADGTVEVPWFRLASVGRGEADAYRMAFGALASWAEALTDEELARALFDEDGAS